MLKKHMFFWILPIALLLVVGLYFSGCSEQPTKPTLNQSIQPPDSQNDSTLEGWLPGTPPSSYPDAPPIPVLDTSEALLKTTDVMGVPSWRIVNQTYSWLGVPYSYGGNSRSGIDCSHLVYQVYRNVGIPYPYMTTAQIKSSWRFICVNPVPGDIIMFRNLAHCGIYIGSGWMIDANSYYGRVMYDYIGDSYWSGMGPYAVRFIR
jgi:cell wall-associated NlpC family hydrolase